MSGLCLFNLKKHNLNFTEKKELSNELVKLVLGYNLGISFNSNNYGEEIIKEAGMHDYFYLSSDFMYQNCDIFDMPDLIMQMCGADSLENLNFDKLPNKCELKQAFKIKFKVLTDIIDILFQYHISSVELFITANYGPVYFYEDFEPLYVSRENLLDDLFGLLRDELHNNFNYEFPNVKFIVER